MKRRSFLKDCLLGMAFALVPKILQPVLPEVIEVSSEGWIGYLPHIQRMGITVDYKVGNFQLEDLHEIIETQDNLKRQKWKGEIYPY